MGTQSGPCRLPWAARCTRIPYDWLRSPAREEFLLMQDAIKDCLCVGAERSSIGCACVGTGQASTGSKRAAITCCGLWTDSRRSNKQSWKCVGNLRCQVLPRQKNKCNARIIVCGRISFALDVCIVMLFLYLRANSPYSYIHTHRRRSDFAEMLC